MLCGKELEVLSLISFSEFSKEQFYCLSLESASLHSPLTFLQSENSPIEKVLGAGESIKVKAHQVIGYSTKEIKGGKHKTMGQIVTFEGPGVVYIETHTNRKQFEFGYLKLFLFFFTIFLALELTAVHFMGINV